MWVPHGARRARLRGRGDQPAPHARVKFLENWLEPVLAREHTLQLRRRPARACLAGDRRGALAGYVGIAIAAAVYLQGKADPAAIELPIFAEGWK